MSEFEALPGVDAVELERLAEKADEAHVDLLFGKGSAAAMSAFIEGELVKARN